MLVWEPLLAEKWGKGLRDCFIDSLSADARANSFDDVSFGNGAINELISLAVDNVDDDASLTEEVRAPAINRSAHVGDIANFIRFVVVSEVLLRADSHTRLLVNQHVGHNEPSIALSVAKAIGRKVSSERAFNHAINLILFGGCFVGVVGVESGQARGRVAFAVAFGHIDFVHRAGNEAKAGDDG